MRKIMQGIVKVIAILCLMLLTFSATVWACRNINFSSPSSEAVPVSDESAGVAFWRVKVTGYCKDACCCGEYADGITASGVPAVGKIISAPPHIPFGTMFDVPGWGTGSVQDRGSAIKGNRLEVLFATHQEALNWGVQELMIRMELHGN